MLSPNSDRRSSPPAAAGPGPGGLTNANADGDGYKGPCLKYGVNESESEPEQQVQAVAYRYHYPHSYHAPHAHYHHPTHTTQEQDRQQHPQPQPHPHHRRHFQHNSNRNGYHYHDPASAWYHYHPHPPLSPHWHSDFEVMADDAKPQPQVYQQGQGSFQSQFFPHSPSRGYYSYPYQYKYQQPKSHSQSQTNDMSPLLAREEVYMEPHSLFGDEYYNKGVAPVLTRARADSSPRYVDEYYTNKAPESTPANADIDSAPALTQARACADSSRHDVDDRYKSTAPNPKSPHAPAYTVIDLAPASTKAQKARVDSPSKNKDHSEAEDVDEDKPPTPFLPPMASNQFTETASESDTLQHLEPLPFSDTSEMTSATGFHSQLQLVLQNSPSPAAPAQDVAPPKKRRWRRRGRHPLSGPGLPNPSDNNSTTVSSASSSSSKSSESKHGRAWKQKIHELVSLRTSYKTCFRVIFNVSFVICLHLHVLFFSVSSIFRRSMAIVTYHRITHQTPALVTG